MFFSLGQVVVAVIELSVDLVPPISEPPLGRFRNVCIYYPELYVVDILSY